jgi:hypothetical protein
MNDDLLTKFIACHSMLAMQPRHRPPLEILAELRGIEQEILQGIEELEGLLR